MNRTFLFAPGDHPRRVQKALTLPTDAVILDLEDAVAPDAKVMARAAVRSVLSHPRACRAYVRVNAFDTVLCFGDLTEVVVAGLDGIMLPKLEDPAQLVAVDWMLGALERERGLPPGGIDLLPIIETARGHAAVRALALAGAALGGRLRRMAFGAADYTLDLGMAWTLDEAELTPVRSEMVLASRAAGLEPPIDTVWAELRETEAFARSCARGAGLGFQGRMCIHPDQLAVANAAYSPSPEAVASARRIVEAFEAATSASIQVDGRFVDAPIFDRARRVLALEARIGALGGRA